MNNQIIMTIDKRKEILKSITDMVWRMRNRNEIEKDIEDYRRTYLEKVTMEVLLDIRDELHEIKEYMKYVK